MKADNLLTEYLVNPVGIDFTRPRLFWTADGGERQTQYRIEARSDDNTILWDSGFVSSSSMHADWGGKDVPPRTKVIWSVILKDENGKEGEKTEAFFETGIDRWTARWITGNYTVKKKKRYPVDCFRKTFTAENVRKARLYITACGLYEAKLNGKRVGSFVLAPGITDYRKRIQYQTYDLTGTLTRGENILTVEVADGWYRGSCGAWGLRNQYGRETKLLSELVITHTDGSEERIVSDPLWDWSNDGGTREADNKDGEVIDNRLTPSYSGKAKVTKHPVIPSSSDNVPVTEHEHLKASLITTPMGKTVLDFGQNIAGYVAFGINAHEGQTIRLRFGELIGSDGEFTQRNIQCSSKRKTTPLQRVIYTCKEGMNEYRTRFAVFGFQYVLVETDVPFNAEDFTAVAVYSDMKRSGWFTSSNPLLDRFVQNTVWSARNNHCDLPTDCPTRERHGWTGDAEIFCPTASFLFSYVPMAEKFLTDMYDWQKRNGRLPQIAPAGGVDFYMYTMNGSVGWSDAGIIMPYVLYKQYGDKRILEKHYDGMKKYALFMIRRCGRWGGVYAKPVHIPHKYKKYLVNRGQSYGEWAEPQDIYRMNFMDFAGPHPEVSTAYTSYVMSLMAEIASVLGKTRDIPLYEEYRDGCRKTYSEMMKTKAFTLDTDRQAQLVRPLAFNLLAPRQKEYARKRLIKALENYSWRIGTGFLSTPLILDVLADIDIASAYRLLENEKMPGWLFMPKNGASTIWESWEGDRAEGSGVSSLDHYSKGAVCRWLFTHMCGIRVDGENHFTVKPLPGGHFKSARAVYDSIYGRIESGWKIDGKTAVFTITVPSNTTADIILPDGRHITQKPGTAAYEVMN